MENEYSKDKRSMAAEEMIVTGSHIDSGSQFDVAFPITKLDRNFFEAQNGITLSDITNRLTFNDGSENQTDAADANLSTGTTNINLRGLGVGSTLVMLNGRRQTYSAMTTNRGESFVDTASLIPPIALSRVEILREGGSALYGSDAVGGVANFVTRRQFSGIEFSLEYQTTTEDSQADMLIAAILGTGYKKSHFLLAFNYLDRSDLSTGDRALSKNFDTSGLGQPGTYLLLDTPTGPDQQTIDAYDSALATGNPAFIMDPDCQKIALSEPTVIPSTLDDSAGFCRFDFSPFFSLVADEKRMQGYAAVDHEFSDKASFFADFAYSRNRTTRNNSPSFPALQFPIISRDNLFNPFGTDVRFFGRALGAGRLPLPSDHDSDTWHVVLGLNGDLGTNWRYDTAWNYSRNDFSTRIGDTIADRFLMAIGDGNFNPFGSAYFALPGEPEYNDPAVIADFSGYQIIDAETELATYDAQVTGSLWEMPGGPLALAAGAQYRQEVLSYGYDDLSNADQFLLFIGNPDFSASRDVYAGFVEIALPLLANVDLSAAVRYEDYDDFGDSLDPRFSIRWLMNLAFSLRGSIGTAFRAPTLFQQAGSQTSVANLIDPLNPDAGAVFRPVRTTASTQPLAPEEAENWNLGFSWHPGSSIDLNFDFWHIESENLLTQQDAQAVLNADPNGPNVIRDATGTLTRVERGFQNVAEVKTQGVDIEAKGNFESGLGTFDLFTEATYVDKYEFIDLSGTRRDGAGYRNEGSFASPVPKWRVNVGAGWSRHKHKFSAVLRYVDSFLDDDGAVFHQDGSVTGLLERVDDQTTVDLHYGYQFSAMAALSIGAINVFDEAPPEVSTTNGYESRIHDPRGRLIYGRLTLRTP